MSSLMEMEKKNNMEKLSKLKEIRTSKKLSRRELALLSGIPEITIQSLETGITNPDNVKLSTLIALAKALKCKIADLVDDDLKRYIG